MIVFINKVITINNNTDRKVVPYSLIVYSSFYSLVYSIISFIL